MGTAHISAMRCLALLLLALASASASTVLTPFGRRPEECVREVPHGSVVSEENGQLKVAHPSFGEVLHDVPSHCREMQPEQRVPRTTDAGWGHQCDSNSSLPECACNNPPCTCNSLPCNSWMDNAGLWTHPQSIGGFSSVYTVPQTPLAGDTGQTLFWFIGAENTDGLPRHGNFSGPNGRTILQPVLTYAPSTNCGGKSKNGWCFSNWNCCPAGMTTHSPYDYDYKPGDEIFAYFNLTKPGVFEIGSRNLRTGVQNGPLEAVSPGAWRFNWADATLEVYNVKRCDEFAGGTMKFGELKLWDTDMIRILKNDWLLTSERPCGGLTKQQDSQTITVQHN